ncbi:unnamed protein product, partial [Prorocentrum cordatum]
LLPLQALPPPAGGGGPGEQRSPAEIARAALRAPGGGDSTRRGVGGRVRSEGATGGERRGEVRGAQTSGPSEKAFSSSLPPLARVGAGRPCGRRSTSALSTARRGCSARPADNWNAWARRRRGAGSDERGNERRGAEAKA